MIIIFKNLSSKFLIVSLGRKLKVKLIRSKTLDENCQIVKENCTMLHCHQQHSVTVPLTNFSLRRPFPQSVSSGQEKTMYLCSHFLCFITLKLNINNHFHVFNIHIYKIFIYVFIQVPVYVYSHSYLCFMAV